MNRTLSPQHVRLVVLLGVLAVVAVALWMFALKQTSESTAPALARPVHAKQVTPPVSANHAKTAHPAQTAHGARPAHSATKSHVASVKIARHGFPLKVAKALTRHGVVVVSLTIPDVALDRLSRRESVAAAKHSHAGFVALNAASQREGGPFLNKLGVVDLPALFVVRRRGFSIFAQFNGFVDRDTVVQAVADAKR